MKILLLIIIFLQFLISSLYMTTTINPYAQVIILALSCFLIVLSLLLKVRELKVNKIILHLQNLLFITLIISGILNEDKGVLQTALGLYTLFISFGLIYNRLFKNESLIWIYKLIVYSQLPLVLTVLIVGNSFPLKAIFYNSNSLGQVGATLYVVILALLLHSILKGIKENKRYVNFKFIVNLSLVIFLFLVVIGSQSRTSLLIVIVITVFSALLILLQALKTRRFLTLAKTNFWLIVSPTIAWVVYKFTFLEQYLYNRIFYKFNTKLQSNNLLSERDIIWDKIIVDAELFGNGSNYFSKVLGVGAHNTYMHFLGQFGWFAAILFFLITMVIIVYALKYAIKNKSLFRFLPLFISLSFFMLSMGEIMTLKISMLAMYASIGVVSVSAYEDEFVTVKKKRRFKRIVLKSNRI